MNHLIEEIKNRIIPILKKNKVKKAGLFGSCLDADFNEKSDIDILVKIDNNISLLDFVGIKLELEQTLNRNVDLIEYDSIKPRLRQRILSQEVVII